MGGDGRQELNQFPGITAEDAARLAAARLQETTHHDPGWYRVSAIRSITGGRRVMPTMEERLQDVYDLLKKHAAGQPEEVEGADSPDVVPKVLPVVESNDAIVEFAVSSYAVMESVSTVSIIVCRHGNTQNTVIVRPNSSLSLVVTEPGVFEFERPSVLVKESVGVSQVPVVRKNGADGRVTLNWRSRSKSAIDGKDFIGGEGTVTFEHGELNKMIEIPIINDQDVEKDENFELVLYGASAGATLGPTKRTIVTIVNDDDFNSMVSRVVMMTKVNMDSLRVGSDSWQSQFHDAMNVNGGDVENATPFDYLMHFFTFGWKILFALIPPPTILGGWLCFCISLMMIGILTAIVGDLAGIFGCLIGLDDSVTAITLVALGTSLPDLFASKQAATMERYADNSIGNVTGSNSVNVFLGLGLPWVIASIYWAAQDKPFNVPSGSLTFSVALYTIAAVICISLLLLRRYVPVFGGSELGGRVPQKYATAAVLITLWFTYVVLSSLKVYGHILL
ncbi:PREDICTED: sodium/calcium exchanger 3-like [Priapulus caudatus]|uniref:Sodium/calcium exchanger 3-like n=1 Tax=Priapulus caudatus TaxID=37621 RepID=A0ABM1ELH9_PRICU|nr:PREDICTED: sodium/calcium exchanger 3-like [Priapulus caudatus]